MKLSLVGEWVKMSSGKPLIKNYDYECDALMLKYDGNYDYDYSLELSNDVIVDFDINGIPCAFEFLNASKLFGFDKSSLMNIKKINVSINVTSKLIELSTLIVVLVHNKSISNRLRNSLANNVNLPELNLAFV